MIIGLWPDVEKMVCLDATDPKKEQLPPTSAIRARKFNPSLIG
jgi:hypothetical protein